MTGARVVRAAQYLGDPPETFCLTYGDGVGDVDLTALVEFHKSHGKLATITGVRPPSRFGEIEEQDGRVVAFKEKPPWGRGFIGGGFFVFEPDFLRYLGSRDECVLESDGLERCSADGQLYVYEHTGYWQCMDTYREWLKLEEEWDNGTAPWKVWE